MNGLDDEGSAAVEFLMLTLLLFIPIVYLVLTAFTIQGASFAAAGAARDGARLLATTADPASATRSVESGAALAFEDFSLGVTPQVSVRCAAAGCDEPGSLVHVTVFASVPLPLLPDFLVERASVPISATATGVIDRFRER